MSENLELEKTLRQAAKHETGADSHNKDAFTAERVFDTCSGNVGMVVQSECFARMHEQHRGKNSLFRQESNPTTYKLAKMNFVIGGLDDNNELRDTFMNDKFSEIQVDYVIAYPAFNVSEYNTKRAETHTWRASPGSPTTRYEDMARICKPATIQGIRKDTSVLPPATALILRNWMKLVTHSMKRCNKLRNAFSANAEGK